MPFIDPVLLETTSRRCAVARPSGQRAATLEGHVHAGIAGVSSQRLAQQAFDIENQCDTTVTENCRTRHPGKLTQHSAERLDYRLAFAEQPIDDQADALFADAQHEHVLTLRRLTAEPEALAQPQVRQRLAAQIDHPAAAARV